MEKDLKEEALKIVSQIMRDHGRVVYGGDNYGERFKRRSLKNCKPNYARPWKSSIWGR